MFSARDFVLKRIVGRTYEAYNQARQKVAGQGLRVHGRPEREGHVREETDAGKNVALGRGRHEVSDSEAFI